MLKDLQVTLYDVFGYLLPGFVCLAGVTILFLSIFMPSTSITLTAVSINGWIIFLVSAYIAGHMVQAIANLITKNLPSAETLVLGKGHKENLQEDIIDLVKGKISSTFGITVDMEPKLIYGVCDEAVVQFGLTSDRDIYIYREGFYRGLFVSFTVFFICLIILILPLGITINIPGAGQSVDRLMLAFFAVLAIVAARLSYNRYQRFGLYRVRKAFLGFLVLEKKIIAGASQKDEH